MREIIDAKHKRNVFKTKYKIHSSRIGKQCRDTVVPTSKHKAFSTPSIGLCIGVAWERAGAGRQQISGERRHQRTWERGDRQHLQAVSYVGCFTVRRVSMLQMFYEKIMKQIVRHVAGVALLTACDVSCLDAWVCTVKVSVWSPVCSGNLNSTRLAVRLSCARNRRQSSTIGDIDCVLKTVNNCRVLLAIQCAAAQLQIADLTQVPVSVPYYGAILYRLWDIASCWSLSTKFYTSPVFSAPAGGDPVGILRKCLILKKPKWLDYPVVNYDDTLSHFDAIPERDRQTDGQREFLY